MSKLREIWRLLNLPCRDMTALLSRAMDTRLPFWERFAVRLHLLYCRACRRFKQQVERLHDALANAADEATAADGAPSPEGASPPGLSAEARDRIARALRNHQQ